MTSWDGGGGGTGGRPNQSAHSSRTPPSHAKGPTSRLHNVSPPQPGSPRAGAGGYSTAMSSVRGRVESDGMGAEAQHRYKHYHHHHHHMDQETVDKTCHDTTQDELKDYYESLLREKSDTIRKLEKKAEHFEREFLCLRHIKDKEILKLRQNVDCNKRLVEDEFEKRLHETISEAEKQKAVLHREHTKKIQDLLDSTNKRLQKMDENYGDRISYLTGMVDELECKLTTLTKDMEQSLVSKKCLKEERQQLQSQLCCLQDRNRVLERQLKETLRDFEIAKDKVCQLELGKATLEEMSYTTLEDTRKHLECEVQILKERNNEDQLQFKCKIASLEQTIDALKDKLKQEEECHNTHVKEIESQHQQKIQALEQDCKKQIQEMQREIDRVVCDYSSRSKLYEISNNEKDHQIDQLNAKMQELQRDYEERLKQEKEILFISEKESQDKDAKLKAMHGELTNLARDKEQWLAGVCCKFDEEKRIHCNEVRELKCSLQQSHRINELQKEDMVRLLEEEKRRCDEKVSKVSEQLNQSICVYEKEIHKLSQQLDSERIIHSEQHREMTEQLQQAKRLQQEQAEQFICQLDEDKLRFDREIKQMLREMDLHQAQIDKFSGEYANIVEKERINYQELISNLRLQHELEKEDLCKRHQKEAESLKRDPHKYVLCLEEKFSKLLTEAEDKAWQQEQCYLKRIDDLEKQLLQLQLCDSSRRGPVPGPLSVRRHTATDLYEHAPCHSRHHDSVGRNPSGML